MRRRAQFGRQILCEEPLRIKRSSFSALPREGLEEPDPTVGGAEGFRDCVVSSFLGIPKNRRVLCTEPHHRDEFFSGLFLQDFSRTTTRAPDVLQASGETQKNEGHIGYVDEFRAVGSSLIGVGAYRRVILGIVEAIKVVQIPARFPLSACHVRSAESAQPCELSPCTVASSIQTVHSQIFEYGPDRRIHGRRAREESETSCAE